MADNVTHIEIAHSSRAEGCRGVIKELLSRNNINVCELARRINLPQPTIHRLVSGKTEDPKLSTLSQIADYFSITIDQLLGHTPLDRESGKMPSASHSIPIMSWHEAVDSKKIISNLSLNNWDNWLLVDAETSPGSFGLKSKKCMEPRFPAGSTLVIDPEVTPEDGDLVIVSYPNTTETTIRELVSDGPNKALLSVTDTSKSDELTKDIKIVGVIVQTRFSYK